MNASNKAQVVVPMNEVSQIINNLKIKPGALLLILHAVQARCGYIPNAAVPVVAQNLNLSRAEVHGVISFGVAATSPRASRPGMAK